MFTLDVVFFTLVGTALVTLTCLILSTLNWRRTGKGLTVSAERDEKLLAGQKTTLDELSLQAEAAALDLQEKVHRVTADLRAAVRGCQTHAATTTDRRADELVALGQEVKAHMAKYSALMESQDRLIKAVGELTSNVETPVRRHR